MAIGTQRQPVITNTRRASRDQNEDREQSEFVLNIGHYVTDEETGREIFVSIGMGVFSSTISESSGSGFLAQNRNDLFDYIVPNALAMEPGEEALIPGLEVQVRRLGRAENLRGNGALSSKLSKLGFERKNAG